MFHVFNVLNEIQIEMNECIALARSVYTIASIEIHNVNGQRFKIGRKLLC